MTVRALIRDNMYYGNRPRRTLRRARRYLRAVTRPSNHPYARVVTAFWFDQFQNFGDALTPWLLADAGYTPRLATATTAQVVGVGSIVEMVPPTFRGSVWGSGLLHERPVSLPDATWLAVRGHLTRELTGAPSGIALGDPGLLVSTLVTRSRPRFSLGIVPHHAQRNQLIWQQIRDLVPGSRIIDTIGPPARVVREIAACDMVFTSSLHGLVTADAYGIPASWLDMPDTPLRGGDFKFRDYASVVLPDRDRRSEMDDPKPLLAEVRAKATTPDPLIVATTQRSLRRALAAAPHTRMSPLRSF